MIFGYFIVAFIIGVLIVCSIPASKLLFPDGEVYEVVAIQHGSPGRRCYMRNVSNKFTTVCEWNEYGWLEVGDLLISNAGKLEKLG